MPKRVVAAERLIAPGYRAIAHLRRGDLYDVYEGWSEERECRCLVKILRPDRRYHAADHRRVQAEGALLLSLGHPHIVRAYETNDRPYPFIVLQAATGERIGRPVEDGPLAFDDLATLADQLGSALGYLHRKGYLHLDLKPSHVSSDRGCVRLIDLSMAGPIGARTISLGTQRYIAPEQMRGEPLSTAVDVWGLGCLLHEAATGRPPFDARGALRAAPSPVSTRRLPAEALAMLRRCLATDPAGRPTIDEIRQAFRASRVPGWSRIA